MSPTHDTDSGLDPAWPVQLPVHQVRIARPTDRLEEVVAFYVGGLGRVSEVERRSA